MNFSQALLSTKCAFKPPIGSMDANRLITVFTEFVGEMHPDTIKAKVLSVYSDEAYFNDTLKELNGKEAIADYLEDSLRATDGVEVKMDDFSRSGIDYYFRWRMNIKFRSLNRGQPGHSEGMSQVRYNSDMKIVLHRDYWDSTTGLFQYIPMLGSLLAYVRGRI